MASVFILGIDGSMGRIITRMVIADAGLQVAGGTTVPAAPTLGMDVGVMVGQPEQGVVVSSVDQLPDLLDQKTPDVVVDFTVAAATEQAAPLVTSRGIKYVVGTTMLSPACVATIEADVQRTNSGAVIASNMSTGMNVFFKIVQELARAFAGWDVEVLEAHHHRKQDAPSGTAVTILEKVAETLGVDPESVAKFGRARGKNPRTVGKGEIGVHAIRAGDIVGDHTVLFAGPGERVELTHRAHSRDCFGAGTIKAIHFLLERGHAGRVFTMQDVLGLE